MFPVLKAYFPSQQHISCRSLSLLYISCRYSIFPVATAYFLPQLHIFCPNCKFSVSIFLSLQHDFSYLHQFLISEFRERFFMSRMLNFREHYDTAEQTCVNNQAILRKRRHSNFQNSYFLLSSFTSKCISINDIFGTAWTATSFKICPKHFKTQDAHFFARGRQYIINSRTSLSWVQVCLLSREQREKS